MTTGHLADRLRTATKAAHSASERAAMEHLFRPPMLNRPRYIAYLRGLYEVYSELETQLDRHQADPLLGELYFPELRRTPAIAADLHALGGPAALLTTPLPAASDFAARLHQLGDDEPVRLVAHVYTRYLGDLSGGQMLRKLLSRGLDLPGDDGLRYLHFADIADPERFKDRFRLRLDGLPLSPLAADTVVAEAQTAFALTQAIFESL